MLDIIFCLPYYAFASTPRVLPWVNGNLHAGSQTKCLSLNKRYGDCLRLCAHNMGVINMLSLEERERRVKAIQNIMIERSIDVLLVSSSSDLTEIGKVRYVSYWPTVLFDSYVILPKKGEMKYFGHYGLDANLAKQHFGIKDTHYPPFGENPGPHIAKLIRGLSPKKIGLCGTRGLGTDVYRALIENIEGIVIEEATDIIENIRMIKSPEELT